MQEEMLEGYRLSPQQRHLWGLLRHGRNGSYQTKCAVMIKGRLESRHLKTAVEKIIARHEILRTTFHCLPGMTIPMQVVNETGGLAWREDDLSGLDEQASLIEAFFQADSQPFDFERGPFLFLRLIKMAEDDYVMIIRLPAVCADSVSIRNLVGELCQSYVAAARGEEFDRDVMQYADLAEWQNDLIEAEEMRDAREYWRRRATPHSSALQLAFEGASSNDEVFEPRHDELAMAPHLTHRIESFARDAGTTVELILLACWHILLWRHTGQPEIEVGTVFDGRRAEEIEDALGLFAKHLPVTCHLDERVPLSELIDQIDKSFLVARNWQEYFSWEQFLESSESAPGPSYFPFCFEPETPLQTFLAGDVSFAIFRQSACIDRFKIKLSYAYRPDGLVAAFHYNSELFRSADIRCLIGQFQTLLDNVTANPAAKVGALEMISEAERRQLLSEYNSAKVEWPVDKTVHELFWEQQERTPEAIAIIYEDERLTYRELNERAANLAHYLRGLGVGPDIIVGICMERSIDLVVSLLAVLKVGGAYLPLDPSYPPARLSFMLEDAAAAALLTQSRLRSRLSHIGPLQVKCVDALWGEISKAPARNRETTLSPDNLAYVIYTSGSTGRPKGVMLRHLSLTNYLLWAINHYPVDVGCGAPVHSSLSFDLTITALFPPLLAGGHVHLLSTENEIESLGVALSERPGYSLVKLTPAHLQLLAEQLGEVDLDGAARSLVIGGENLPAQTVRWWRERAAAVRLFNEYGPTESVVGCCVYEVGDEREMEKGRAIVPIGRPIANTRLYILDGRQRLTPNGVVGELYIAGAGLARGYLSHPDLTAERFVPDPYSEEPGRRMYRTGDRARYLRDGHLECLGRVDDQVKFRGYRIELGEIEAVLRDLPGVREAVVMMVSEDGQNRLIGYVVGDEEQQPDIARTRRYLQERLPDYMVPAALLTLDALPLNANGKIDRKRLSAMPLQSLLKNAGRQPGDVETQTPVEEILAGIFQEVLRLDQVGKHDNFFEIGGHSLLATQIASRVRNTFGVEIGVRGIFKDPTIASLAARIGEPMSEGGKGAPPPLVRTPRDGRGGWRAALSFAQQRLWFIDQLEPGNPVYNSPGAAILEGPLNLEALERSVNEVVKRHEALRTRFEVEAGEPAQVIDPWEPRSLEVEDLTGVPAEERDAEVKRIAGEEAGAAFDLRRGPLLRMKALKLGEEEHVLLFTIHHIVSDAWSMAVLVREIGELYQAISEGRESPLPELEIQYTDYAKWQREYLTGEAMEGEIGYWKAQLQGAAVIDLPTDHARPATPSHRGSNERVEIDQEIHEGLRMLSQREGATLFMTLMAAFKTLLMRYSGEEDLSVGTAVANRTRKEVEGLIGFFVNTLVIRTNLGGNPSFRELIKREREVALGAYAHQEAPFEKLVEEINPERDLSRSPLFQIMMVLQNARREDLDLRGLKIRGIGGETGVAKFDLTLILTEGTAGIAGYLEYGQDLYERETIRRMARHYEQVVKEVVRDAEQRIWEIELLSEAEKRQIVEEWNETRKRYEETRLAHELIAEQARRRGNAIAIKGEQGELSYEELNRRSNQLGNYLRRKMVGPEDVVGICTDRTGEMVIAMLGVLKAGAAYVPIDGEYPEERVRYMLEDSGAKVLLTQGESGRRLGKITPAAEVIDLESRWEEISREREQSPEVKVERDNLAYLIYTSGSTGRPKGVVVAHKGVCNLVEAQREALRLGEQSRVLQFASLSFDASVWEIFSVLAAGGSLHIYGRENLLPGDDLVRALREDQITTATLPPTALAVSEPEELRNLQTVIAAGEACGAEIVERWAKGRVFFDAYGPTEATVCASMGRCEAGRGRKPTIGRPIANTRLYILDREMRPAPVGVRGELYISGVGLARGYWGKPELAAERFIPDPFGASAGERLYRTGDLCRYLSDGSIEFIGRADEQVKIHGYRIELGEIEAVLNELPGVRQSIVVVREDERGDKRLVGYVVGEESATAAELKRQVRERLPNYMAPEAILVLEEMPISVNGKIDRKRLPSVKDSDRRVSGEYDGPRTPTEETLVEIFRTVLRLDRVGVHDNFFEIGGDSILSIQIISKANEAGLRLTTKQLFQRQNIAALAAVAGDGGMIEIEQEIGEGDVPLTPIQEWFFEGHVQEPERFNQAVMLEATEELDVEALRAVVRQLVKQHDVLRHKFHRTESGWMQVCKRLDGSVELETVDISETDESLESKVIEEAAETYQRGLNLSEGPLMRVVVFGGKLRRPRLLIIAHHLIIDGVSWRILLGDLERGYAQARRREAIALGSKTTSYQRWAKILKEEAQSERLREALTYWLAQAGKRVRALPVDKGGANTAASGKNVTASLTEAETTGLLQDVARTYKTQINEVLLSAVARAISEWSNERTVLVELEGHGREEVVNDVDLTRTVGWFTTLYPVVMEVGDGNSVELLRNVKEQIREASRRGIHYGMLKYLSEEADQRERLRALPKAEVSFNYLGQLDLVLKEGGLFRGAKESVGLTQSLKEERRHLIEINGGVSGGRLHLVWTYSENVHRRETIDAVAERAMTALREVIAGSRSTADRPYAPSDFPLAVLNQRRLDRLIRAHQDLEDIYVLSPLQKAMLFHTLSGSNPLALFVQWTCHIRGKVDLSAFRQAWQRPIDRHPILRTAFEWEELDEPVQVVRRRAELPIDYLDWGAIAKEDQERRYEVMVQADHWRGFDLSSPPLMRLSLIRLRDDLYRLIWSHHHILLDGWSSPLILQEVFAFYEAYQRGQELVMEERAPYRDYIAWLKRQDLLKAEAYWRERLRGFNQPTTLWIDRRTGGMAGGEERYEDQQTKLTGEATAKLQAFARRHRLTMNTVLQGAWGLLLSKYSGEEDLVIGTTVSGRPVDLPGNESIIGPFINTLPIRIRIPLQSSILSWLSGIQSDQVEFGQYAYSSLVEQYSEIPLGMPLYESILIFENYPVEQSNQNREQDLEVSDIRSPVRTKYPLTITSGTGSRLPLSIAYDLRRFDSPDVVRLLSHLQNIIERVADNPEQPVWSLSLLSQTEQAQLLAGGNRDKRVDSSSLYVHQRLESQTEKTPDTIAVILGQEHVSYSELNRRANQLAHHLQALGVGPEVGVGIYLEPSPSLLMGMFGVIKAGGAVVALASAEQTDRASFGSLLQESGVSVLLTEQSLLAGNLKVKPEIIRLDSDWEMIRSRSGANPHSRVGDENLAFIISTSGSTGEPRRVMITHRGWRHYLLGMQEVVGLIEEDRVLQQGGLSIGASTLKVFAPLLAGACLVMARPEESRDHGRLLDLIAERQITTACFTPSLFSVLLKQERFEDCRSFKRIMLSGETLSRQIQKRCRARLNVDLYNLYSVTEVSGAVAALACGSHFDGEIVPVGQPVANARIHVLDAYLQPVPTGAAGEVWISGEGLGRCYVGQPDLTAESFIPNPCSDDLGERMFRTKDVARCLPGPKTEVFARSKREIEIKFGRINPALIESALMERPGIDQAALLFEGRASGLPRLTAFIACGNGSAPSAEELRRFLRERFPAQMVPSTFLIMKTLPLTADDRIDRKALEGMRSDTADAQIALVNNGTPHEEMLSAIWSELFGVDEVGGEDNFFEMGGHSLLATQLMSRVRDVFKVEIPLRSVFEEPTIKRLALRIEEMVKVGEMDTAPPLVKAPREGQSGRRAPLSFAQRRLWFLDQLAPNNPLYNCPAAVRLEGRLDLETLERSVNEVVKRHEALRTRFEVEAGEPAQAIDPWQPRSLEVEDLTSLASDVREAEVRRISREEAGAGFDLRRGPLMRMKALKLGEEAHVLLFTMHHIISDRWSMAVLVREVNALYEALSQGKESPLPELEIQYADYAAWQREYLAGEALEGEVRYWKEQLEGAAVMDLPGDRMRPASPSYQGGMEKVELGKEVSEGLRTLSQREGATNFMVLMAAFKTLLMRYSGEEDISIGTVVANRTRKEVEGLIGFFVNTLVMRTNLGGNPSFRELIKREREVALGAYAHQEAPFEKLVEEVNPERDLSRSPLFQIMMTLQNMKQAELEISGLSARSTGEETGTAKFDLTLMLTDGRSGIAGYLEYSQDLYERETIRRMARHYEKLVAEVVRDMTQKIREIALLSEAEKNQILQEWNQTHRESEETPFVHEMIADQARRRGEVIALRSARGELSYGELERRANQLAHYLLRKGMGPECVAAICAERSIEMVIAMLGVLKAGAAYAPIDGGHPEDRVLYLLEDSGAKVLLTQGAAGRRMEEKKPGAEVIDLEREWEEIGREREDSPEVKVEVENLAYVIYTSGSTGRPKGVMIRHGGLSNYLRWAAEAYRIGEGEGAPVNTSIGFDLTVTSLYGPLVSGKRVDLVSEEEGIEGLANLLRGEGGYSLVKITPAHLEILAQQLGDGGAEGRVRALVIGGEELKAAGLKYWQERARGTRLINEYGPTETVVGCSVYEVEEKESGRESAPIGRPISNARMYILDEEQEPAPIGVRGEIYISGEGVGRGYLGKPELTAERFIPDRYGRKAGERVYRSGDVGRYLWDGKIEYVGRRDEQVKVRGYRIELGEIQAVLNEHRSVKQSVVIAVDDERGSKRLIGYVVAEEGTSDIELKRHVREKAPEYMSPDVIVILEEMPVTANGKIDRKRLPEVKEKGRRAEGEYEAPRTPTEEMVAGIFEEVVKVEGVGRNDNFFEIGGHSLLATQVVSRVRSAFGVEMGVRSVFESPTAEGLARRIDGAIRAGEKDTAPPLVKAPREGQSGWRAPLSFAQQRLWFLDQLAPNNPFYNNPNAVRLEGRLDLGALEGAINEVVRRHETLRTRFEVEAGEPAQAIDPWEPHCLEVMDLTGLPPEERDAEVGRIAREEASTGFDLRRGPLLRMKALKLGEEEHVLLFTTHHIVSDAWSMGVLAREVGELYQAISEGRESPLPELEIQYADYAKWQREYLTGEAMEGEIGYWKAQLQGAAVIDLSTDHARPAAPSYRGGREKMGLSKELSERLRKLSQREGATLFMTLMAAFKTLLMRYSGEEDLSVGTAVANRTRKEVEGLIGFFVNTLVMRTNLGGNPSFRELIKREREVALGAYAHQEAPFERLVEEINPERDLSRSPLFQIMMVLENTRQEELDLRAVKMRGIGEEGESIKFDLTLRLIEGRAGIAGYLEYSQDLYERETIRRMARHYEQVAEEVVRNAEQKIGEIEFLSEAEKKQTTVEWNETERTFGESQLIHEVIAEQARLRPGAIAVIYEEERLSYKELEGRANQLAHYLRSLGAGADCVVGLYLERSTEMVVGLLGILKAGAAYLPLEVGYPIDRLSAMLEDSGARIVVTKQDVAASLPAGRREVVTLDRDWEQIASYSQEAPEVEVTLENLAYLIYTSGSTGRPKGVMVRHWSLFNYTQDICRQLGVGEREGDGLQFATISTIAADLGNTCIYPSLVSGGSLHILSYEVATDGARYEEYLKENSIDALKIVPSHMSALLGSQPKGAWMLPGKYLILGGEALSYDLWERVREQGARCEVINHYGPTETTVGSMTTRVSEREGERQNAASAPIGRPIANTKVYILDQKLMPVPVGVKGELYIAGAGLARGYWGKPELTAERFIPNQLSREGGDRLYWTGDVVRYLSDGKVEFIGRADNQVKVRGYRIELGEIEAVLNEHEGVRQSVVVASEGEGGEKRLLGYVVGTEALNVADLKRRLRERMPEHMVPETIVILEEMPITANGKIDRKRLPVVNGSGRQPESQEALTPVEEMLAGIFEEVLKLDRVQRSDNFFELGGHSLLATQVISRVRNTFGVEIGVRSIFEEATVEGFARRVEGAMRAGERDVAPPLVRVSREGQSGWRAPLSFAQQRLWFIDQLAPNNPFYNNPNAARLEGRLDLGALEGAINEIIRRHETLRTRFEVEADEPAQVIDPWEPRSLEIEDLTNLPAEEREAEVERIAREEARTGFDLRRGPLLRMKALKLAEEEHVLLFTTHHIVSDAWSMGVLVREVGELYQAISEGRESRLPELEIQYADYAYWQRYYLKDEVLEEHLRYWKTQFSGKLPVVNLASDLPRPLIPSYRGAAKTISLPIELSRSLKALSKREGVTLFMALLAAFKTLLYRYTSESDLIVGIPIENRNRAEIERLIGFFVNMLPMRTDLSGNPRFTELLKRVKGVALGAYAHQELPFEKLVEEIQPERELGQMPLFNIAFGVQNAPKEEAQLTGLKISPVGPRHESARLDLTLWIIEGSQTIEAGWVYSTDLFEEETIVQMHNHLETLLSSIVARPDAPLDELEMLSEAERSRQAINRTIREEHNYSRFKSVRPRTVALSDK